MAGRRVVLTGLGTVNPMGHSVPEFWDALLAGRSGIAPIIRFDATDFPSRIGGEVKNWETVAHPLVDPKEAKRMDRFAQLAVASAIEAVLDSGLDFTKENLRRCGVIVGSGIGGLQELEDQHNRMLAKGPSRISPFTVPKLMGNAAAANIAIVWGLRGLNYCVVTACASAAHSIGQAFHAIRVGEAEIIISGGSEAALTPIGLASFCSLKGLSTRNDDPEHASRPWDRGRDGFLLSEGAGVLVLEELEHAKARGAEIYCELTGYGKSCDGYHITAPDPVGTGAVQAMEDTFADAGCSPDEIDYVNAHGTSTSLGDVAEVRAMKKAFGDHARKMMVSSTKSATGHTLGASGGIELIVCALGVKNSVVPPTLNLDDPDDECDLDFVPKTPRQATLNMVLSNSFGFGGHNGCLIIRKFES